MSDEIPRSNWLLQRLASFGPADALVHRSQSLSFAALVGRVATWLAHFRESGITSGDCVAISGDYSPDSAALLLAIVEHRAIAVMIPPAEVEREGEFVALAEVRRLYRFQSDDSWTFEERDAARLNSLLQKLRADDRAGLVLFSSGSTGKSKAIVHSFDRLLSKFVAPRKPMRTLVFLLLDHIGGIDVALGVMSSGGTLVTALDRKAETICKTIEEQRVELLPTSPTFLRMLLISGAHERYDLSSLKVISYGTEPMPESTLVLLQEALPQVRLKQTYGLTELGAIPMSAKDARSLWFKSADPTFETKVVDGTLHIRTRTAMLGYLNEASRLDADGWYDTQDAVDVDGDFIRIRGRASEIINIGGEKVYPAELEEVILKGPNVAYVSVSGRRNAVMGAVVAVQVAMTDPEVTDVFKRRLVEWCRGRLPRHKQPMFVDVVPDPGMSNRLKKKRGPG